MQKQTIVTVGGGYAGLHAVAALHKEFAGAAVRLIWLNRDAFHVKKVRLVQAHDAAASLTVPLDDFGFAGVERLQGELTALDAAGRELAYTAADGRAATLRYDRLVLALGSVAREPAPHSGGLTLRGPDDGAALREALARCLAAARAQGAPPHAAVIGGGISGVELAAELAGRLRREAAAAQLRTTAAPVVTLVSAAPRLLPEASEAIGRKLERQLARLGVRVLHGARALRYAEGEGRLELERGGTVPAGLCVWALGTKANPLARQLGLPAHADGRLLVDPYYRVERGDGVYAIGDCARLVDPRTGQPDGMTCKEAIPQAQRLGRIIAADSRGEAPPVPPHAGMTPMFCIGLGEAHGFAWARRWGLDIVLSGKLARKVREYTWNTASFMK